MIYNGQSLHPRGLIYVRDQQLAKEHREKVMARFHAREAEYKRHLRTVAVANRHKRVVVVGTLAIAALCGALSAISAVLQGLA